MSTLSIPAATVKSPQGASTARRRYIAFGITLAMVAAAAILRESAVSVFNLHLTKLSVNPRRPVIEIKSQLGPWMQVSVDRKLNPDMEHELGTAEYVMRNYTDTRLLSPGDLALLQAANLEEREKLVGESAKINLNPKGMLRLALTYYTGSADTVPHVPERCFAADGWTPDSYHVVNWAILPREDESKRYTDVRMMSFENQISVSKVRKQHVCYFFQVNGDYEQDAIFGVRRKLQNIWEAKAYFAKIELATADVSEAKDAEAIMQDFLKNAMPEIERVLPDWQAETEKKK